MRVGLRDKGSEGGVIGIMRVLKGRGIFESIIFYNIPFGRRDEG
jgi:hypothetical protein